MKFFSEAATPKTSKAGDFHCYYNRITDGRSRIQDWKALLDRGIPENHIELVLSYIERGNTIHHPSSGGILRNWDSWLRRAEEDLEVSKYPYTLAATDICTKLAELGQDIPPEYAQHTMDEYRAVLDKVYAVDKAVWAQLPPAYLFTITWFSEILRYGCPRIRKFATNRKEFISYLSTICKITGSPFGPVVQAVQK